MKPDAGLLHSQCSRWLRLFSELDTNGVPTLEQLRAVATDDVYFTDPFNQIRGVVPLQQVFEHTHRHVRSVRFRVHDTAWSGMTAYVRWTMTGRLRVLGDWTVEGVSEIRFSEDGRIMSHIDHWDAASQFFGRLPLIGWLLRRIAAPARAS